MDMSADRGAAAFRCGMVSGRHLEVGGGSAHLALVPISLGRAFAFNDRRALR